MGYYLNAEGMPARGKADWLIENCAAVELEHGTWPPTFDEIPDGKAAVVVLENGPFDAAGFAFSEDEYEQFIFPDGRPKRLVLMDVLPAARMSGYYTGTDDEWQGVRT